MELVSNWVISLQEFNVVKHDKRVVNLTDLQVIACILTDESFLFRLINFCAAFDLNIVKFYSLV